MRGRRSRRRLPHREPCRPAPVVRRSRPWSISFVDLFPKIAGEVIEVRGNTLTLDEGQKDGVHPGLELEVYREGREIKHPKTGELLGRTEEPLGRTRITSVQEAFSQATTTSAGVKPGDRYRASSAQGEPRPSPAPRRRPREPGGGRDSGAGRATGSDRALPGVHGRSHQCLSDPGGHQGRGVPAGQGRPTGGAAVQAREPPGHLFQARSEQALHGGPLLQPPAAGSRDQHGVLRAALHPIGGRAGRQVLLGRRAGESTRRPSRGRSWPGCSGAIWRPAATRAGKGPFRCARWPGSPSRCWPWTWRSRRPIGSLAWW